MINKAIKKIKDEIDNNKNNSYVEVVGIFLIDTLNKNPEAAEKFMDKDKTILKSLELMKKEAMKKKLGNCAVLADQEVFAIVLKYFGIDEPSEINKVSETNKTEEIKNNIAEEKSKNDIDFDINLEDLL